ncbi:MAG: RES domain-containing protein [Terriglobales bacterium]
MALETKTPTQPIYRVGRWPDAWQPPDWSRASPDGTFGNRFDDPESYYRLLYASSQEVACFIETLARFRPDLTLLAELQAIEGEDDFYPSGEVPAGWRANRVLGTASAAGDYAEICGAEWITLLRRKLASECLSLGINDLDVSVLQSGSLRRITQLASHIAYECGLSGIYYRSRYGSNFENWALFEPFQITQAVSTAIERDYPPLIEAAAILKLKLG